MSKYITIGLKKALIAAVKILAKEQMSNPAAIMRQGLAAHLSNKNVQEALKKAMNKSSAKEILKAYGITEEKIYQEINTFIN